MLKMKRLISFLLAFGMVFAMLPVSALAEETESEEQAALPAETLEEPTLEAEAEPGTDEQGLEDDLTASMAEESEKDIQEQMPAAAEEEQKLASGSCGENVFWELSADGILTVYGSGEMSDFGIGNIPWYDYRFRITAIEVCEGVTSVGGQAFRACSAERITLPDSLKRIGFSAFGECVELETLTIPVCVSIIEPDAFRMCRKLQRIDVAEGNPVFCSVDGALLNKERTVLICCPAWRGAQEYRIPDGVQTVADLAFDTGVLKTVWIPASVIQISANAFTSAWSLQNILVDENNPYYASADGVLYDRECKTLVCYPRGKTEETYTVPYGVTALDRLCFSQCKARRVLLPDTLRTVGDYAFAYSWLKEVAFTGSAPQMAFPGEIAFCGGHVTACYPAGDSTWTEKARSKFGYDVTWVEADPVELIMPYIGNPDREPLELSQSYLALQVGEQFRLKLISGNPVLLTKAQWTAKSEGSESVIAVDENGNVTALHQGTAYAAATVTVGEKSYCAQCRIDVAEEPIGQDVARNGVVLAQTSAAVQLYGTNYTKLNMVPVLSQNLNAMGNEHPENKGAAVEAASFANEMAAMLFDLRVLDDRTLEIIPTEWAMSYPQTVKSSYISAILLTVDGQQITTPAVTLTVQKTLPYIKAAAVKINSFDLAEAVLSFTGGTVTAVEPDGVLPAGFALDGMRLIYTGLVPKLSTKLNLMVQVAGYAVKRPVTVSVSVARTVPAVKLSASSAVLLAGVDNSAIFTAKISPAAYAQLPLEMTVTDSKGDPADTIFCSSSENTIQVLANGNTAPGTYKLTVRVQGADKAASASIKLVKPAKQPKLNLKVSGAIDQAIPGSWVKINYSIPNYHFNLNEDYQWHIYESRGKGQPETDVTERFECVAGLYEFVHGEDAWLITAEGLTKGCTYTFAMQVDMTGDGVPDVAEARIKLPVKWSNPAKVPVSVSLKTKGSMDVLRHGTQITVTPTIKNWFLHTVSKDDLVFYIGSGKSMREITGEIPFRVDVEDGKYVLTANGISAAFQYSVAFRAIIDGAIVVSKPVKLPVKMGTVKLSQNVKAVTLTRKDQKDSALLRLVPADVALTRIARAELDRKSAQFFMLEDLGGGSYTLSFRDHAVQPGTKTMTVKLSVWMEGNDTTQPNTAVSVKVTVK